MQPAGLPIHDMWVRMLVSFTEVESMNTYLYTYQTPLPDRSEVFA